MTLTHEQKEVIDEFVAHARNTKGYFTANDCRHQMLYDFNHGRDKSLELFKSYFDELVATVPLTNEEFIKLRKIASKSLEWKLVKDIDQFDSNDVVFDGHG